MAGRTPIANMGVETPSGLPNVGPNQWENPTLAATRWPPTPPFVSAAASPAPAPAHVSTKTRTGVARRRRYIVSDRRTRNGFMAPRASHRPPRSSTTISLRRSERVLDVGVLDERADERRARRAGLALLG